MCICFGGIVKIDNNSNNKWKEVIITIHVLMIFAGLPLVYRDYYFDILAVKYYFYCSCVIIMSILILGYGIYAKVKRYDEYKRIIKCDITDIAILTFWIFSLLSTVFSPYKFEAFWGNEGRLSGFFLLTLYTVSYFFITRWFRLKQWHLDLFLAAGIMVCLLGITDYFRLDILSFKVRMSKEQYEMFTSTIGNINTYTAYVGLVMAVSVTLFVISKDLKRSCFYFVTTVTCFFAIIMGTSDNAYISLGVLLLLLPCFVFDYGMKLRRYLIVISTLFTVIQCIDFINTYMGSKVLGIDSAFNLIIQYKWLSSIVVVLWIMTIIAYIFRYLHKEKDDRLSNHYRNIWMIFTGVIILAISFIFYDANFGGHPERYNSISNYIVFNDAWGTYRGFVWKLGMEEYMKLPLINKIFGSGPETLGILLSLNRRGEMVSVANQIYDAAHNEYLQFFITIGPFGLAAYITFLVSSTIKIVKNISQLPYLLGIAMAIVCYSAQAIINISLPITTPIFLTLLMCGIAACRYQNNEQ